MNSFKPIFNQGGQLRNPNGLPPNEVRITNLKVEAWPDGKRIRVHLNLTPFQQQPNLEVVLLNSRGNEVTSAMILEAMLPKFMVTLHIREPEPGEEYTVLARLSYEDLGTTQEVESRFTLPYPESNET